MYAEIIIPAMDRHPLPHHVIIILQAISQMEIHGHMATVGYSRFSGPVLVCLSTVVSYDIEGRFL
jgi:hypothetical protein